MEDFDDLIEETGKSKIGLMLDRMLHGANYVNENNMKELLEWYHSILYILNKWFTNSNIMYIFNMLKISVLLLAVIKGKGYIKLCGRDKYWGLSCII